MISQVGISMILPIFAGVYFGNLLDEKLGTNAIFLIILTIVGVVVAFMNLFKLSTRGNKRK
ncbi:MAG: AtpZ/AtpI family protein [Firmicutes bacterium]|nr:AtpZ/AtpI family protein [Bacillota bacterium]